MGLEASSMSLRNRLNVLGTDILALRTLDDMPVVGDARNEIMANVTLAFRHLQDAEARLRLAAEVMRKSQRPVTDPPQA